MNERQQLLRDILLEASEIKDAEQQAAFLAQACGMDSALRREVEELLRATAAAGQFLPEKPVASALPKVLVAAADQAGSVGAGLTAPLTERPGDRIGRYKLLQKIGEGGCGVVYMAEQEEPVRRKVALKVVKLGMDTRQVIARFEAEQQALALMDHPNIAKVLDAGATGTGRPFFVMELVRGRKITDYADQHELSTRERLELFVQVCQAVQHAHQKGIIHRDLKPSNILVTVNDDVPVPKVIDFGIAKATEGRLTDQTVFTAFEQFLGTPAYMSPEQTAMTSMDVDTRSDIYSLGVLLYELLTGKTPFETKALLAAGLDEPRRTIREQEPPRPSTRLTTMAAGELVVRAKRRAVEAPKLISLVRGDLDWIVMKCLEKDRTRRYQTANGLATDIRRHLSCEPVAARPPSRIYEFRKTVRRHLFGFVATQGALDRAEGLVGQLALEKAEMLFAADDSPAALAYLARQLRESPSNRVAASRLVSGMTQGAYLLPEELCLRHDQPISYGQFSPSGTRAVTASLDGTAAVWDAGSGRVLFRTKLGGPGLWAGFSPDESMIATATESGTVQLWNTATGQTLGQDWKLPAPVSFGDFSPGGEGLALAAGNGVQIRETRSGRLLKTGFQHDSRITCVRFSPDGPRLVTASFDNTVRVWNVNSGEALGNPFDHGRRVWSAEFSPDGQRLLIGGGVSARVYDLRSGQLLCETSRSEPEIYCAKFSPDGRWSAVTRANHTLRIWDAFTGRAASEPAHVAGLPRFAEFSPDGRRLLGDLGDGRVRVWQVPFRTSGAITLSHGAEVKRIKFSPDGRRLVTVDGETAQIWDVGTAQLVAPPLPHRRVPGASLLADFSPDGEWLATGSSHGQTARIWSVRTGEPRTGLLPAEGWLNSIQFSPDGRELLTGSYDGQARLWDVRTGARLRTFAHRDQLTSARFSPEGRRIVTASIDRTARVWETETGRPVGAPMEHNGGVYYAEFSLDGNWVVTASADKTARVWDAHTGQARTPPMPHRDGLRFAHFSSDGRLVVTSSFESSAQIWNAHTGEPFGEPFQHQGEVVLAQFSPDGQRVVTVANDHVARVWDTASGRLIARFPCEGGVIFWAEFSPDSRWLATGCEDGAARLCEIPPVPVQAPSWLCELAEGVAGQRFTGERTLASVPVEDLIALRRRLVGTPGQDFYGRWAKWFITDPPNRTLTPSSSLGLAEQARSLLRQDTIESLREAAGLAPTNALVLARLARRVLAQDPADNPRKDGEADWLSRRALLLAPSEPAAMCARAEVLGQNGKSAEALAWVEKALQLRPGEAGFWSVRGALAARANRLEEAYESYSKAIDLAEASLGWPPAAFGGYLSNRWQLLGRLGRPFRPRERVGPGLALSFAGDPDYARVAHANSLNSYPLTVELWFAAIDSAPTRLGLATKYRDSSGNGWSVFIANGRLRAWYFGAEKGCVFKDRDGLDGGLVADGRWHHAAFTVDASGGTLYVDGEQTALMAWTGVPTAASSTEPLIFGRYSAEYPSFGGCIDEVRVWHSSRTPAELRAHHQSPLSGSEPDLVAYYRFDDGGYDYTGHGNTAEVVGPAYVRSAMPFAPDARPAEPAAPIAR